MVSTNTPINGASHRNNTLIFQQNSAEHHKAIAKTAQFSSISQNSLLTRLVLLFLIFFSISFFTKVNACSPNYTCNAIIEIPLLDNAGGFTPLDPLSFVDGTSCTDVSISPSSIDCNSIDSAVAITLTIDGVVQCPFSVKGVDNISPEISCPQNIFVSCSDLPCDTMPVPTVGCTVSGSGMATATDNCTSTPFLITYTNDVTPSTTVGTCEVIERTWKVDDGVNTPNTCVQMITIQDASAPVLDFSSFSGGVAPGAMTVSCIDLVPAQMNAPAMDNCGNFSVVPMDDTIGRGTDKSVCAYYDFEIIRTWEATDGCGNTDTHTQSIIVKDEAKPVFLTTPSSTPIIVNTPTSTCDGYVDMDMTNDISDCAVGYINGFFRVIRVIDGAVVRSDNTLDASEDYDAGLYDFEFTAIDPCGNFETVTHQVEVKDDTDPVADCEGSALDPIIILLRSDIDSTVIDPVQIDDDSYDACSAITLSVEPDTVTCNDLYSGGRMVTLTVTDANMNTKTCDTYIIVMPDAPKAACKNLTVELDAGGSYFLSTADEQELTSMFIDTCFGTNNLNYSFSQNNFDCSDIGTPVSIEVTGFSFGSFLSSTCNSTITVLDKEAPSSACVSPYNHEVYLGDTGIENLEGGMLISGDLEMHLRSGNDGTARAGFTEYRYVADQNISFNLEWDYSTEDARGESADSLTILIQGSPWVDLTDIGPTGSIPLTLNEGDIFRIRLNTLDNAQGAATAKLRFQSMYGWYHNMRNQQLNAHKWTRRIVRSSDGRAEFFGSSLPYIDACSSVFDYTFSTDPPELNCDSISLANVELTITDKYGNSSMCNTMVFVQNGSMPDFECENITGYLEYDPYYNSPTVVMEPSWLLTGDKEIYLESFDWGQTDTAVYTVVSRSSVNYSFDWKVVSTDSIIENEVFGYYLNGVYTQLNSDANKYNVNKLGSSSIPLSPGDEFGLFLISNGDHLTASVYVDSISVPFVTDFHPTKWHRLTHEYFTEKVFIHGEVSDGCFDVGDLYFEMMDKYGNYTNRVSYFCDNGNYSHPTTIRVHDNNGNSTECTGATVSIVDNIAPIAVCPLGFATVLDQNGEYVVDNNNLRNQIFNASYNNLEGNCGLRSDSTSFEPAVLDCSNVGPNTITVTVKDASNNSSFCTFDVNIQENYAPVIYCPNNFTVDCEDLPMDTMFATLMGDTATAIDNCNMADIMHSDMVLTSSSTTGACYDIIRTWTAVDTFGNQSNCNQTITVFDNNTFTLKRGVDQRNKTVACIDLIPMRVDPTTPLGCNVVMLYDTLDTRIDTINGVDTFFVNPGDYGFYNFDVERRWFASNCNAQDDLLQTIRVRDNEDPLLTRSKRVDIETTAGRCDANVSLSLSANDISDCVEFQYLTITNDSPYSTSGTEEDASGRYPLGTTDVTFTITDLNSNTTTEVISVIVRDAETPNMNCKTDNTITVNLTSGGVGSLSVTRIDEGSNDACGLDSLYITPSSFSCADVGANVLVTLTGVDASNNKATCTTLVEVREGNSGGNSLTINCPSDITILCPQMPLPGVTGTAVYNSSCGNANLTYSDDKLTTPSCGEILRTWTATIAGGSVSKSCIQTIEIDDNSAPVIVASTVPNDTTVNCAPHTAPDIMADDNCLGMFVVEAADTIVAATYSSNPLDADYYNYTIERTWSANDSCGGVDVVVKNVFVQDTTKPLLAFPDPLVISTDANNCSAQLALNLSSIGDGTNTYISDDCANNSHLKYYVNNVLATSISGLYNEGTHPFTVKVEDPSGNSNTVTLNVQVKDEQDPSAVCTQNEVIVLPTSGGNAFIDETLINGGSADNCTAPGDLVLSIDQTSFAVPGTVMIELTVTDETGNKNTCFSNATVVGGVVMAAPTLSVAVGSTSELLPITVSNFNQITDFSINVDVADATVLDVLSLMNIHPDIAAKGTLSSTATSNGYVLIWSGSVADPLNLLNGEKLFDIEVDVTGSDGETTEIELSNLGVYQVIMIGGVPTSSQATSTGIDGEVTVINATSIHTVSGSILTHATSKAVSGVTVMLSGTGAGSDLTDINGDYDFSVTGGDNVILTPSKNTGWKDGVTINDALIALQYPSHGAFNSGYNSVAADANGSNGITGHDAIQIFQLAVDPAFTSVPGNDSWRFVSSATDISAVTNPFGPPLAFAETASFNAVSADQTADFVAVKTGDLDGDVDLLLRGGSFKFGLEEQLIQNSQSIVKIPFLAKDFQNLKGYQFSIDFETKLLEFVEAVPGELENLSSFNFKDALTKDGKITTGWMNLESSSLDDDAIVFTLVFRSIANNFQLSEAIDISDSVIPMLVVDEGGIFQNQIELEFQSSTSSIIDGVAAQFALRQNVPNPFRDETIIGFNLPKSSAVVLNFIDASGKLLYSVDGEFGVGYNEVKINENDLPAAGVVFYQLQTAHGTLIKKMIILE